MTEPAVGDLRPMSDRRFITVLVSGFAAVLGVGLIAIAVPGLQGPVYTDFDTGTTTDTSRTLVGLIALGGIFIVAGASTVIPLFRAQLSARH